MPFLSRVAPYQQIDGNAQQGFCKGKTEPALPDEKTKIEKKTMRESFIFHAEYIDDLPEDYKGVFGMYALNYGIYEIEPTVSGLEKALWLKIKRRIDSDVEAWEQTINQRSEAGKKHRGNQYTRKNEQTEQSSQAPQSEQSDSSEETEQISKASDSAKSEENTKPDFNDSDIFNSSKKSEMKRNGTNGTPFQKNGTKWNETEQNGTNGTVSVFDSVSVSEFESVSASASESVRSAQKDQEKQEETPPPKLDFEIARKVYDIFDSSNLPCGTFMSFIQGVFPNGMKTVRKRIKAFGLDESSVIDACRNYASVVNDQSSFFTAKLSFDSFCRHERFRDFLPDAFVKANWLKWDIPPEKAGEGDGVTYELCPKCKKHTLFWNTKDQMYECSSCKAKMAFEEVHE